MPHLIVSEHSRKSHIKSEISAFWDEIRRDLRADTDVWEVTLTTPHTLAKHAFRPYESDEYMSRAELRMSFISNCFIFVPEFYPSFHLHGYIRTGKKSVRDPISGKYSFVSYTVPEISSYWDHITYITKIPVRHIKGETELYERSKKMRSQNREVSRYGSIEKGITYLTKSYTELGYDFELDKHYHSSKKSNASK